MKLTSLNVGQPRVVSTARANVVTSIFKEPVQGRRKIVPHNVEGDRQADLRVHGGPHKAVYAYAQEHYHYWADTLSETSLPFGMFGENLTIEGGFEGELHIGDVIRVGTALLRVTQPRMPCFKLALRFERAEMVKRFWKSGRSGVYFAIEKPGDVGAGDEIEVAEKDLLKVSVADVLSLYRGESNDAELYARVMASPLRGSWKEGIRERWTEIR